MKCPRVIYKITHNVTKRVYIGSTYNFDRRIKKHINLLRAHNHSVEDMQKDFDNYGENYDFEILGVINTFRDRIKEYELMDKYNSGVRGVGYNYKDKHYTGRKSDIKRGGDNMYPNLEAELVKQNLTILDLEKKFDMPISLIVDKLYGHTPFTFNEAVRIKRALAVDTPLEILFEEAV